MSSYFYICVGWSDEDDNFHAFSVDASWGRSPEAFLGFGWSIGLKAVGCRTIAHLTANRAKDAL